MRVVSIGNGLYARVPDRLSLIEQYRKLQATCPHLQRDPKGICYGCGHRKEDK